MDIQSYKEDYKEITFSDQWQHQKWLPNQVKSTVYIMIIDDDKDTIEMLKSLLHEHDVKNKQQ